MRSISIWAGIFSLILCSEISHAAVKKDSIPTNTNTYPSFTGEVQGNKVRLRTAPHSDSTIIKELFKGDLLAVVGETKDYYIVSPPENIKGYVFHAFISDNIVDGEQVNVRLEPSTTAPVITRLTKGTQINGYQLVQNKWLEIQLPECCSLYVAKHFVANKGDIDIYTNQESNKKIALDLLKSAKDFATQELAKPLEEVNLESIYQKINVVQTEEFKNVSGLQEIIQSTLEHIQDAYLAKSLSNINQDKKSSKENIISSAVSKSNTSGSILSKHIRKQVFVKSKPQTLGREALEQSLFKVWVAMQPQTKPKSELTKDAFYNHEKSKLEVLTGTLESYPHIVKNKPGDYILKNHEYTVAFLYGTHIDLESWLGKKVSIQAIPRPNNHFAFPAYFVIGIQETK